MTATKHNQDADDPDTDVDKNEKQDHISSNKMLTISGFIKDEVYQDLKTSLAAKDYGSICYDVVELVCTRCELKRTLSFLVDHFSRHGLPSSTNIYMLNKLSNDIHILMGFPARSALLRPAFRHTLCDVVLQLANACNPESMDVIVKDMPYLTASIEPFIYNTQYKEHKFLEKIRKTNGLGPELFRYLNILYSLLKRQKKKGVLLLLSFIIQAKQYHTTLEPLDHELFRSIKAAGIRKDIVWYLLYIAHYFIQSQGKRQSEDVYDMLMLWFSRTLHLFTFGYQQKVRHNRLNLLFNLYSICCGIENTCGIMTDNPDDNKLASKAIKHFNKLFVDILGTDELKENKVRNKRSQQNESKSKHLSSCPDLTYLKLFTTFSDT